MRSASVICELDSVISSAMIPFEAVIGLWPVLETAPSAAGRLRSEDGRRGAIYADECSACQKACLSFPVAGWIAERPFERPRESS